jgi:DHA1 family multidrug resistance protein-like MFS transporter
MLMVTLSTLSSLGVGLLGPIYPIFVINRFSASFVDLGFLYAVVLLIAAFFKTLAGKLVDIFGKEKVFFCGVMIGAACSLSYMFAYNLTQLYVIEFFFGVSYALQRPSLLAFIVDLGSKEKKGLFLGVFESVYDVAEALAAVLSTIIVSQIGFEPLFLISSSCQITTGFISLKSKNHP